MEAKKSKRVFLDIGHGNNTWSKGRGKGVVKPDGTVFEEHQFNSDVFIELKKELEKQGFEVDYKQPPHSPEVGLKARSSYINEEDTKNPYVCVVSLHANSSVHQKANGYCVFYWHTSEKGKELADIWVKYAKELLDIRPWSGGAVIKCVPGTWTDFHMVRVPNPPCLLIEHFFFTNFEELERCNTPEYIKKFARVTAKAICEFGGVMYHETEEVKNEIPEWKTQGLEFLAEKGIITDKEYWLERIDEPMPVWAATNIIARIEGLK